MVSEPLKVYVDTSVFGGVFDEEFTQPSAAFFRAVRIGIYTLVVSDIVKKEIADAPAAVRDLFREFPPLAEIIDITHAALTLRDAYINAGILSWKRADDALHVALATVSGCSMIVSWNFKHIMHFQKVPLYNETNAGHHFGSIGIHSPLEVLGYGGEEEI